MRDTNPIRTLGDYSKPSHEGYRNTIELPVGNNMFSLHDQASNWLERLPAGSISTWEDLTTRFLAQFFPPGRTTKLHNDILMFQQHHGESLLETDIQEKDKNKAKNDKTEHGNEKSIGIDYVAGERLRKLRPDEAWATIEELAQYEDEG
ncbi:zinc finger, CCHC-type containing protein [Tanacetum coccineum]